jgi:hypothetical protein
MWRESFKLEREIWFKSWVKVMAISHFFFFTLKHFYENIKIKNPHFLLFGADEKY